MTTVAERAETREERQRRALELRDEGLSHVAIAEILGVGKSTVWTLIGPKKTTMTDDSVEQMRHMREVEKMSNSQIARKMGVSRQRVSQVLGPIPATRDIDRTEVREIRMTPEAAEKLKEVAKGLGYVNTRGGDAMRGSIVRLGDALVRGEIQITKVDNNPPK